MATPTDQNDMMKRITATAIPNGLIVWNISIRSRPPSIGILQKQENVCAET